VIDTSGQHGLIGCLELPSGCVDDDADLTVTGWIFGSSSPVLALEVVIDSGPPMVMSYGLPRPDIAAEYDSPEAGSCGFQWTAGVGRHSDRHDLFIEVFATLQNGARVRCFRRSVLLIRRDSSPLLRITWLIRGAMMKAWLAFREGRLPLSPRWWIRAMILHWQESRSPSLTLHGPQPFSRQRLDESYEAWLRRAASFPRTRGGSPPSRAGSERSQTIVAIIDDPGHPNAVVCSLRSQADDAWRLWLAYSDPTLREACAAEAAEDDRVRLLALNAIPDSNECWLPPGDSSHVVLLDGTSILAPDALSMVATAIGADPDADWIYTDDDCLDDRGRRCDPYLKGEFSPALAMVDDFATRLAIVNGEAIAAAGGLRTAFGAAQLYDLLLRVTASGGRIRHYSEVCCHRRAALPPVLTALHRQAAEEVLRERVAVHATMKVEPCAPSGAFEVQRIAWNRSPHLRPAVTIVIPTRDRRDLLEACVTSLRLTVDPLRTRLLIVDDHSTDPSALALLEELRQDTRLTCRIITPPRVDNAFNYSRLMNAAAAVVDTPLMLHLNNDVEGIQPGWIEQMEGWFALPDVGIVGAKLLYPDGSIQHAGVLMSPAQGVLDHVFARLLGDDRGYQGLPHRVRDVSAVTGACLLTTTSLFRELGGFDEHNLAVQFNDVDFCMRARAAGRRVLYEPGAVLYHRTSATRGRAFDYAETLYFLGSHRGHRDPFHSPHFDSASLCCPTPTLSDTTD
jgi:O-antigen biosynthesis protein